MTVRDVSRQRALVVDDEPLVRQVTMRALTRVGFVCDAAANGKEALQMARQTCYGLVVTDLRMPESNGHSLAIEILSWPRRPALIVLTGVLEPRLAKDLTERGVDAVCFKPVRYEEFAAQAARVADAHWAQQRANSGAEMPKAGLGSSQESCEPRDANASAPNLPRRLKEMTQLLPAPEHNFDAFRRMSRNTIGSEEIVMALRHDSALIKQVLRLVNCSVFSFDQRIRDLEESIASVNHHRRKILTFAAGMFAGWALSSLCLATWLLSA